MRIVTQRELIRSVRKRWIEQFRRYDRGTRVGARGKCVGEIEDALNRLDLDTCSEADIDAAIGTKGWAAITCDECHSAEDRLVRVGDEPDYDMRWQDLCANCLRKATELLTSPPP